MGASEKAVASVMDALGCTITEDWTMAPAWGCSVHTTRRWGHRGCDVAVAAADAAVDTDRASIQARALRDYASELDWTRPAKCPCEHPEHCCGSEQSCDAMQPVTRIVGAVNLRARADQFEAQP